MCVPGTEFGSSARVKTVLNLSGLLSPKSKGLYLEALTIFQLGLLFQEVSFSNVLPGC